MKTLIATALAAVALTLGAGTPAGATDQPDPPTCYEPAAESQYKKFTAPTDAGPWTLYGTWWKGQANAWWPGNAEVVEGPGNHPDGRYTYRKVAERATEVEVECPPETTTPPTTAPPTTEPPPPTTTPPVETTPTTAPPSTFPPETPPATTPEETTPTTPAPEPTPAPSTPPPPPPPAPLEPQLPATGSTTGQQIAIAAAALAGGTALARVARRRTS